MIRRAVRILLLIAFTTLLTLHILTRWTLLYINAGKMHLSTNAAGVYFDWGYPIRWAVKMATPLPQGITLLLRLPRVVHITIGPAYSSWLLILPWWVLWLAAAAVGIPLWLWTRRRRGKGQAFPVELAGKAKRE